MSRTRLLFRKYSSAPNIITAQELALFARFILLLKLPEYPSSTLKPFRLKRSVRFMASFVRSLLTGITEIGRSRKWVLPNKRDNRSTPAAQPMPGCKLKRSMRVIIETAYKLIIHDVF